MKRKAKIVPVERRAPLGDRAKVMMLAVALRNPDVFDVAQRQLREEFFFDEENRPFGVIWASACEFQRQYGRLPEMADELLSTLEPRVQRDAQLTDDDCDFLDRYVPLIYDLEAQRLDTRIGLNFLSQFVEERLLRKLGDELEREEIPRDLPAILEQHQAVFSAVRGLTVSGLDQPFPDEMEEQPGRVKIPSGVDFVDDFLDGGPAEGEVVGFAGPFGSCKTTLSCQLAAQAVGRVWHAWRQAGDPQRKLPTVYIVVWEEPLENMRIRLMSCAARIKVSSLEAGNYKENLSTADNLKPYERERQRRMKTVREPGEYRRFKTWQNIFNHVLRVVDFTGGNPALEGLAVQGVEGLRALVEQDQRHRGNPGVALFCLDYAGAAAKRMVAAGLASQEDMRHVISSMPLRLKNTLALRYRCPAWVFHQLDNKANALSPGRVAGVTELQEAKNFYEHCDFGINVGQPTKPDRLTVASIVKARRTAPKVDKIVRIDGEFARVAQATNYGLRGGKIVPLQDLQRIAELPAANASLERVDVSAAFGDRDIGV